MSFEKPSFEKPSSELSKAEIMARVEQIREAELEGYMASRVEKSEELRGVEFPRLSRLATIGALSEEVINQLDISDEEKGFL
ncbi:MAG: hypothetical protein HYT13_02320 [Candidatus Liptonbacteria bacterium]|nr:hypothetical protein [Candidatus Liptonbacteria bacterium]